MAYYSINRAHIMVASYRELSVKLATEDVTQPKKNMGSVGCRQLLAVLQQQLNLTHHSAMIALNETQFPYYFMANHQRYWVSFSHSREKVAVMVISDEGQNSSYHFGIDIENKVISDAVTKRFFCAEELVWLEALENCQKALAKKLLWTLKESLIKAQIDTSLVTGLKNNLLQYLDKTALEDLLQENKNEFNQVVSENGIFGFSPKLHCGLVMIAC